MSRTRARFRYSLRFNVVLLFAFLSIVLSASAQTVTDSRLKTIATTKTIKLAYRTDARPFSFVNDNKEIAGFTIDLCKLVVASIQQQLGLDQLTIEWVPVTVATRFSAVVDRTADMECGSSTVTLGRMKEVDFSNYIFVESTGILVKRDQNFRSFTDFANKKIAVISGTTNERALNSQMKAQRVAASLVPVKNRVEGIGLLESGAVDGYASDKLLLIGADIKNPEALTMLPDDLSVEPYALVLPRDDWAFRLAVNTGLAQIYRTGQILILVNAWFSKVGLHTGPILRVVYGLGSLSD